MANQLNKELLTMQGHLNAFAKSKFTNKALMADISKKVKELSKEKNALDEFVISGKSAKGKNACMRALEARRAAKRENARLKKAIWVSKQSQQHSSNLSSNIYTMANS
jgi:cob(I)alamin adenosyltransferase